MEKTNKYNIRKIGMCIVALLGILGIVAIFLGGLNKKEELVETIKKEDGVHILSTVSVGSMGDLLIHRPVLAAFYDDKINGYNFSNAFSYITPYIKKLDYAVIDIEGTLAANNFSGYPTFKSPDSLVDAAMECGFDMFLIANNHSNDGGEMGFIRTQKVLRDKKADYIGARIDINHKKYMKKTINGIKLGFVNYTYGNIDNASIASVNGLPLNRENSKLINVFDYDKLDMFYKEQETLIQEMLEDGVDKIIYYMHWGNEYNILENDWQRNIAQKLADLGVDIIIGGHPHVIQPVDIIHSDVSNKDTICLYSMGNALSNQRRELLDIKTGHTEDGVLFMFSCTKYSDGKVLISNVDVMPTWVNKRQMKGKISYQIVPLDKSKNWSEFELTNQYLYKRANDSYNRTMDILKNGIDKVKKGVLGNLQLQYPKIYN